MVRKQLMKLSGAKTVFKGEIVCGKPDSVVNRELVREAELFAYSAILLF